MFRIEGLNTIFYQKKDCIRIKAPNGTNRWICPKCFNHVQTDNADNDCKTIIYVDEPDAEGRYDTFGQCCCYSDAHS